MENKNNNTAVISLLIVIIVILATLCVLFATGTISFNANKADDEIGEISNSNNSNDEQNDEKINIQITMDSVTVSKDAPNAKIFVDGTIDFSYDTNKYIGLALSGYCLGAENEKYFIHGPGDGAVLFNDTYKNFLLTENIPQNVEYSDGTVKSWDEMDWENVKIKYCKIDKMTAILNEGTNHPEFVLNFEKNFN